MVRAAVFHETGQDKVEFRHDMEALGPDAGEVKVRIRVSGVCHTDLSAMNGTIPYPPPAVLGHEAAGEVVEVGPGVKELAEGDHVIMAFAPPCGACTTCQRGQPYLCLSQVFDNLTTPRFRAGDTSYFGLAGLGTFAEEVTVAARSAVKVAADVPFDVAALIACGVMTGVGSVLNVAAVRPGESVAVIGCGGVGISVIQGARVASAGAILAVDMVEQKLEWARQFGATDAVTPADFDDAKQQLTGGEGFDHVFDVVGAATTLRTAFDGARRGGQVIIVGVGRSDESIAFSPFELWAQDRKILPSTYGAADVRTGFPQMLALWRSGHLDVEGMISQRLELEELNDAFAAMTAGEVIRQVITFP